MNVCVSVCVRACVQEAKTEREHTLDMLVELPAQFVMLQAYQASMVPKGHGSEYLSPTWGVCHNSQ